MNFPRSETNSAILKPLVASLTLFNIVDELAIAIVCLLNQLHLITCNPGHHSTYCVQDSYNVQ